MNFREFLNERVVISDRTFISWDELDAAYKEFDSNPRRYEDFLRAFSDFSKPKFTDRKSIEWDEVKEILTDDLGWRANKITNFAKTLGEYVN